MGHMTNLESLCIKDCRWGDFNDASIVEDYSFFGRMKRLRTLTLCDEPGLSQIFHAMYNGHVQLETLNFSEFGDFPSYIDRMQSIREISYEFWRMESLLPMIDFLKTNTRVIFFQLRSLNLRFEDIKNVIENITQLQKAFFYFRWKRYFASIICRNRELIADIDQLVKRRPLRLSVTVQYKIYRRPSPEDQAMSDEIFNRYDWLKLEEV